MKAYQVILKIEAEKSVVLTGDTTKEVEEIAAELLKNESIKLFDENDIKVKVAIITNNTKDFNDEKCDECCGFECKSESCEDCEYFCKKCSSCAVLDELFESEDKCVGCKCFCDECCSCTFIDDFNEGEENISTDENIYADEELSLRENFFNDYATKILKDVFLYGNELFNEEE